jgi:receptor protein-tyrosine kinase
MSTDAGEEEAISFPERLRDALLEMGSLTLDEAGRVDDAMRTFGLGFADAAISLGLVTSDELYQATHAIHQIPPRPSDGIIERALHKRSMNRKLPVKYVRMVEAGRSLILAHDPDHAYSEQIRALRTELLLLNGAWRNGISLVILGPCRGEGRTQLSAELATAFSQLGQRTLLVDADLRRPRIHALFDTDNSFGLGQALASGVDPEFLGVRSLPNLSVLIAGASVQNPLELLTNGDFQREMYVWRKQYNMIIVDTPPISEFADGLAISSFADQVVIVGRTGSTPHHELKEMLRRMGGTQSRIVGAVMQSF